MSLKLVSLTGADDRVTPKSLAGISAMYAIAEWAILYFPEREGTPRNPSAAWREYFLAIGLPHTAAHLCGTQIFRELLNPVLAPARIADLSRYGRIQLNINARRRDFSEDEVLAIYRTLFGAGLTLILQLNEASSEVIRSFAGELPGDSLSRLNILFDESKGKGTLPEQWQPMMTVGSTPLFCGYAGGLGPMVLVDELPRIHGVATAWRDLPYWIDMESGVRTDNEFDLKKAEAVLKVASGQVAPIAREGVYFASKVMYDHRWQALRDSGVKTSSTWIDERRDADHAELSERCLNEIAQSERMVLYCHPGTFLRETFFEAGAALMAGTPVFFVGRCEGMSHAFRKHALWHECSTVEEAIAAPVRHPLEVSVRHRLDTCEDALRSLAIYLGVGGYNAPTVDATAFAEKIRWGIDHFISVEARRKQNPPATPQSIFMVIGTRCGQKEDITWTLTAWPTEAAAEAHVAFLEAKLQEAANQVAEGRTNGLDYPVRAKIEELMSEHDPRLELGTNGAGWSVKEVKVRTDVQAFSVKDTV